MKPNLNIMCGLPRCGKSTWIANNKDGAVVVSPDDIRKELFGHQFHAPANHFVFGIAEGMATLILKQGIDVIIDATNITKATRSVWKGVASKCNANAKLIWVFASTNKEKNFMACLERNELSPKDQKLPMDALLRMATFFEDPDPIEEDWFELEKHQNSHKRNLPVDKRIIINDGDDFLEIMLKGEKLWGAAENKGKGF